MKIRWPFALVALMIALTFPAWAQDVAKPEGEAKPAVDAASETELAAIRETEASFKKAFDSGDAQAVAAHWTTDGEFIDESGNRLQGREAIAKAYAAFFTANPGVHLTSHIERLRLVNAETAVEDGTDVVEPAPAGAPGTSRYSVVHVKRDGKWLMWSVRETRLDTPSNYAKLEDLDWLIGTWVAESNGVELQIRSNWVADKNFIEQSIEAHRGGKKVSSAKQVIGWDPASNRVTSWVFSSDGGHAVGSWRPHETGWIVESVGTMIDGTPATAVNILTALDNDAFAWRSVNRTAGAFRVLDTNEIVLKRKPAEKK